MRWRVTDQTDDIGTANGAPGPSGDHQRPDRWTDLHIRPMCLHAWPSSIFTTEAVDQRCRSRNKVDRRGENCRTTPAISCRMPRFRRW